MFYQGNDRRWAEFRNNKSLAFLFSFTVVAFAVAANQNKQLLGKNGLLPSDTYLRRVEEHFEGDVSWRTFLHFPTLLLYGDKDKIDWHLGLLADAGLALSGFVLLCGCANMIIMIILWVLYHSIVNIGQRWWVKYYNHLIHFYSPVLFIG